MFLFLGEIFVFLLQIFYDLQNTNFSHKELHFICDTNCRVYDRITTRKKSVVLSTCVELSLDVDRGVIVETARSGGDVHIHTELLLLATLEEDIFTGADIYLSSAQT